MGKSLLYRILFDMENLSPRSRRELELCMYMLSEEELLETSSIRIGYEMARERAIEIFVKDTDPELYQRLISNTQLPVFGLLEEAKRYRGEVEFSNEAIQRAVQEEVEKKEDKQTGQTSLRRIELRLEDFTPLED